VSTLTGALELETKSFGALEIKDAVQGEVTAIVATLSVVDKDGDVLLPGAFPPSSAVKMSAYGHDVVLDGAAPVGKGTISVQGDKAVFQGRFFMSTERGREAFHMVKELGADGEWSFGFPRQVKTLEPTAEWRGKGARRIIAGIQPIEASPVFRGAGIGTGTVMAKATGQTAPPLAALVDLPEEVDMWTEAPELAEFAIKAASFGFQQLAYAFPSDGQIPLSETFLVKWFDDENGQAALYDQHRNHIWLNARYHVGNPDEIIRSLGHEIYHAFQWAKGWPTTHEAAEFNGEHLLVKWTEHVEALAAKAAAAARPIVRRFAGTSFDPTLDAASGAHADLDWESRRPRAARTAYAFDREVGVKYNLGLSDRVTGGPAEAAFRRLEIFANDLYSTVVRLNGGNESAWQESGWYDRLAATFSGDLGDAAGGTLTPSLGTQASINAGLADLFLRLAEVRSLEKQLGDQLETFRQARGALAVPTSAQIARLLPPKPQHQQFVGSTST